MEPPIPNIRHLLAFREVAALKRVGLAAEKVHLSQPAITQAIAKLETVYDARLFDRCTDGMHLTEIGAILLSRVERTLAHLRAGAQTALRRASRAGVSGGRRSFHKLVSPAQLRALVAIARAGSYSQAARETGARQPAVYRAARDLEDLAGVPFFEPVRNGVTLTPSAEAFVQNARLAIGELRQVVYEIDAHKGQDSTQIFVGSLPLSRTSILPAATHQLLEQAGGGLQIHCIDGLYPTLLRDLKSGEIDFLIGALRAGEPPDDIVQEPLFNDRLSLFARPGHPLSELREPQIADTLAYPWIAPPKETPSGSYLYDTLQIHKLEQSPVRIVSSSLMLTRGLMQEGDFLSIMSENQYESERAQGLLQKLDIPLPDGARPIGLTYRADWKPTATQARFLDIIRQYCRANYDSGID